MNQQRMNIEQGIKASTKEHSPTNSRTTENENDKTISKEQQKTEKSRREKATTKDYNNWLGSP